MIKTYLRQAWTLIKQNKLYSAIYIVGTGLSVALIMMVFIIYYIKFAPIYPEYNRNRTMVIKDLNISAGTDMGADRLSYHLCHDVIPKMKYVKDIAIINTASEFINDGLIIMPKGKENITVKPQYVNDGYWRVFTFNFLSGRPFTASDEEAQRNKAVISESLAKKIYGSSDAVGKYLENNGKRYEVSGVVEDVSDATPSTYADIWMVIPKSAAAESDLKDMTLSNINIGDFRLLGNYYCYMTVADEKDKPLLKKEIQKYFSDMSLLHKKDSLTFDLNGQPDSYIESTLHESTNTNIDYKKITTDFLVMMFALLFVPALNLCRMISSRMDGRLCEMGIRKAFGARRKNLLSQILYENLILTAIGSVAGLIIAYVIIVCGSNWILNIFNSLSSYSSIHSTRITFEMLFNPIIIGTAILVCMLLNIVSAMVPAVISLRHSIIYSINTKR